MTTRWMRKHRHRFPRSRSPRPGSISSARACTGWSNVEKGTAYHARIKEAGMELAGKTGTSQVRRISKHERMNPGAQEPRAPVAGSRPRAVRRLCAARPAALRHRRRDRAWRRRLQGRRPDRPRHPDRDPEARRRAPRPRRAARRGPTPCPRKNPRASAREHPLPARSAQLWPKDPPPQLAAGVRGELDRRGRHRHAVFGGQGVGSVGDPPADTVRGRDGADAGDRAHRHSVLAALRLCDLWPGARIAGGGPSSSARPAWARNAGSASGCSRCSRPRS